MKRLFNLVAWILAMNFLAALGGVVYLNRTGHLNKATALAIKALLYPPPVPPPVAQAAPPDPSTQPSLVLDDLLRQASGRSALDQVNFIQQTFDARMAELDRRQIEMRDQQNQIDLVSAKLAADRTALEKEKKEVADREQQDTKLLTDQGFQDTLQLYNSMPPLQVKKIFMTLKDQTVAEYLQAMDPGTASKIIKQYKTPDEILKIQGILEMVRQPAVTENQ